MSREAARTAIMTKVKALATTWTEFPLVVESENNPIDIARQVKPYLCVQIEYSGGFQRDMNPAPGHRSTGGIILSAATKVGGGSRVAERLLNHFYPAMHMSHGMPPIKTWGAKQMPNKTIDGWEYYRVVIPFYFDDILPAYN